MRSFAPLRTTEGDCDPSALSDSATRTVIRGSIAAGTAKAYPRSVGRFSP